jgi:aldehyde dehydrogenase (NAD+)
MMPVPATPIDQLEARCAPLRAAFARGAVRDVSARKALLRSLLTAVEANEAAILEAMRLDMGKPAMEAYIAEVGVVREELLLALRELEAWMAPEHVATPLKLQVSRSTIHHNPLGVVLIIAPWNYPLLLLLGPLTAALAAGNCAVLKPSEDAPHTSALVERLVREALPPDVVTVVHGHGHEVVPPLIERVRFDHVFFTGSPAVGAHIATLCAPRHIPCTLELGGKSPAIVDRSANLDTAVRRIIWSKCFNAGQTCVSTDHALVHADVLQPLLDRTVAQLRQLFGDDPQRSPHYARIVNDRRWLALQGMLDLGTIRHGGRHDRAALYIEPTVITDAPLDSRLMREEIFGPLLPVIPWRTRDELASVLALNPHPLAAYLFTRDRSMERWFTAELPFGGGCINDTMVHFGNPHLPFGGVGPSGHGRCHGRSGFLLFSNPKGVMRANDRFDPALRYPPYTPGKLRLLRWLFR